MSRHSRLHALPALAIGLALASWATEVRASGFQLVEQNGGGLGNAHAGEAAAAEDASTVFFNPAGMTRLEGKNVVVSVNGIGIGTDFTDTGSAVPFLPTAARTPLPVPLGSTGGDAGGWTPVPNAYLSWKLTDKAWFGLGVGVPFGLKTEWDNDWMGRFHAVKSEIQTLNVNPSLAYKVSDMFSIGAGASYQRLDAELSTQVAYGGISVGTAAQFGAAATAGVLAQLGGPAGLAREGLSTIEGDSTAWGFNGGVMFHPNEDFRLGLSYRSKYKHTLEGEATFVNAPTFSAALGPLGAGLNAIFANGPVETEVELPDILSVAFSYQASEKLQILGDWTYTGWGSIQELEIVRTDSTTAGFSTVELNFEDTWRVGLGLNYQWGERTKLRFGAAYDKAPVQDEFRTPRLPDQNRVWLATGAQFKVGEKGALDLGYAHIFVEDASSHLVFDPTDPASAFSGNLVGTYTANVNIVTLQYRHSF